MNSIIEIKNLSKIYDEVLSHPTFALKNIDFSIALIFLDTFKASLN